MSKTTKRETDGNKINRRDLILLLQILLSGYEPYISQSFQGLCIDLAINEGAQQLEGSSFKCSNKMLLDLSPRLKKNSFPFLPIEPEALPPPAGPQQFLVSRAQQKLGTVLSPVHRDSPQPIRYCIQLKFPERPGEASAWKPPTGVDTCFDKS